MNLFSLFIFYVYILLKQNNFLLLSICLIKKNATQIHMEVEQNEDTHISRGYPNTVGYEVLVFIPLRIETSLRIPELYRFKFEEDKIRPRSASLPCLNMT
jgi:hypothetical protein